MATSNIRRVLWTRPLRPTGWVDVDAAQAGPVAPQVQAALRLALAVRVRNPI